MLPETGRTVYGRGLVSLLISVVLLYVVQVVASDHYGPFHLHLGHHAAQNTPSNAHVACKGALLVDVCSLDGVAWRLEAQSYITHIALLFLSCLA